MLFTRFSFFCLAAACRRGAGPRGFTAVEALVTVAISALLLAAAAPSFQSLFERRRVLATAAQLASDVQLARSEAIARHQPVRLSVHTGEQGSCYLLHTGAASDCACQPSAAAPESAAACHAPSARVIKAVTPDGAQRVRISANVASLQFDPLHGTSTPAGTLRVEGARGGQSLQHVVNVLGRVRTCSPQGGVPGYPAC